MTDLRIWSGGYGEGDAVGGGGGVVGVNVYAVVAWGPGCGVLEGEVGIVGACEGVFFTHCA